MNFAPTEKFRHHGGLVKSKRHYVFAVKTDKVAFLIFRFAVTNFGVAFTVVLRLIFSVEFSALAESAVVTD